MKYILLTDRNIVQEIIPDVDPTFPDTSIRDRYPSEFIDQLLPVSDSTELKLGWEYDFSTKTFFESPIDESQEAIEEYEPLELTLEEIKSNKIFEINNLCGNTIHAGLDIETSIGIKHFNMSDQDQINLLAYRGELLALSSDIPSQVDPEEGVWYKSDSEGDTHRFWSVEDFMLITNTLFAFKVEQLTYCDYLKTYIRSLEDIELISQVYYGMKLE